MRTLSIVGLLVLLAIVPAHARRLKGEWTNAYQGGGGTVRFIGTFKADTGTVQGRLRCKKGCPVRGKFNPTCTGDAVAWYCTGAAGKAGAGCTGSGYVYRDVFEKTWDWGLRLGDRRGPELRAALSRDHQLYPAHG